MKPLVPLVSSFHLLHQRAHGVLSGIAVEGGERAPGTRMDTIMYMTDAGNGKDMTDPGKGKDMTDGDGKGNTDGGKGKSAPGGAPGPNTLGQPLSLWNNVNWTSGWWFEKVNCLWKMWY